MTNEDKAMHDKRMAAIADAIRETIVKLGIDAVRRLSWFPSNRKAGQ